MEKSIENSIVLYLRTLGYIAWANENVATFDAKRNSYRTFNSKYKLLGVSDILALSPIGVFTVIEIKKPTVHKRINNNLSKWIIDRNLGKIHSKQITRFLNQHDYIESIVNNGGKGGFASSIECVKKIIS